MTTIVTTDSAELHLTVGGQGPIVMLVHGGPGTYDYLSGSLLGDWLARAHTVVGYDQRGCRHSPSAGPFTVDANVADLEALRRYLGAEHLILIGHSWGGLLSMGYAAAHADRLAGLVLIGSIGPRARWESGFWATLGSRHTPGQRRRLAEIDSEIARTRDPARRGELYRERYNVALPSYLAPVHRHLAFEIESFSRLVAVNTMADMHRTRYRRTEWETGFTAVTAPVTMIHGRQDPVPWSVVDDVCELLPQARVVPLEDCGHFPWLEAPVQLGSALSDALADMHL